MAGRLLIGPERTVSVGSYERNETVKPVERDESEHEY